MPASLDRVESAAEDLVDVALAHRRAETVRAAKELPGVARAAAPSLRRAGVSTAEVRELERRAAYVAAHATGGSFVQTALNANQISGLMPELFAHFGTSVPPRVLTLDYLERETQLRALAGQRAAARTAVDLLGPQWSRLRAKVIAAGGAREARVFDGHVRALQRLRGGSLAAVEREAARGLELVDDLERVFG